jgi:MHS family proline/betaine transporter-like MFS transporter
MTERIKPQALAAGAIGNVLEWYDFAIYGFLAPIMAAQFFPSDNKVTSLIAAFGVLAAGYFMRPVGGLLIGHIGDRMGRKPALTLSIAMMAVPTGLIAVLPDYAAIGIAAPLLLTLIRLVQGVSVGGEYTGSIVFLTEHAPRARRALVGSAGLISGNCGVLLASAVAALLSTALPADDLADWGWRLAFLPGPIIGVVGIVLRRHIHEVDRLPGPDERGAARTPIGEVLRDHRKAMIELFALSAAIGVAYYIAFVYLTTYLSDVVGSPRAEALDMNTAAIVFLILCMPGFAWLSDRIGRRPVMLAGSGGLALLSYPLFLLLHSGDARLELAGDFSFAFLIAAFGGPAAARMVELFPHRVRFTGVSVGYSLPMGVIGGSTPLVATWLIAETGNPFSPAFYLMAFALLGVVALLFTPETNRRDLD